MPYAPISPSPVLSLIAVVIGIVLIVSNVVIQRRWKREQARRKHERD